MRSYPGDLTAVVLAVAGALVLMVGFLACSGGTGRGHCACAC